MNEKKVTEIVKEILEERGKPKTTISFGKDGIDIRSSENLKDVEAIASKLLSKYSNVIPNYCG